jgi:DNA-binding winged helix-turn-helix (wHTH) protein
MQDLWKPQGNETEGSGGASRSPSRFAGLVLDFAACTLTRDSGEPIPLTRGEFALLRLFVTRHGRALSRDAILNAIADRPLEPFDRSVDVLVSRLRRKVELDPKAPRLIVTVPGEGYRFDGKPSFAAAPQPPESSEAAPVGAPTVQTGRRRRPFTLALAGLAVVALALAALGLWPLVVRWDAPAPGPPRVAVLPFANLSGDNAMDYLGPGLAMELTSLLATYPGVSAVSPPS